MIAAIWAREGDGKTTMALTFPKPIVHFDLDVGGYDRAAWRLDTEGITSKPYTIPVQMEKMMGAQKEGEGKEASIRFPRRVVGYKELWQKIVVDYVEACQSDASTVVIDSATQLWTICHTSLLQEKQEIQVAQGMKVSDPKFRERLQPVEFPNDRMRSLIYTARSFNKNLVLTHYPRNIYKQTINKFGDVVEFKSDDLEPDGFKDTAKLVDILVWLEHGSAKISIKCGVPGLGMTAVGMALPEATYDGIVQLQKAMRGE